jgi:hypothetical protein
MDAEEQKLLNSLLQIKSMEAICMLESYGVSMLEIYQYSYGFKSVCELSYEMQCALYDLDQSAYELYADEYFMSMVAGERVDKSFILTKHLFPDFDFAALFRTEGE